MIITRYLLVDRRTIASSPDEARREANPPSVARLHAVALKDLLTRLTQLTPILLEAVLNGHIVAQLLTAKTFGIRGARSLFFWRTHVPL
jgi:hypothetical protein